MVPRHFCKDDKATVTILSANADQQLDGPKSPAEGRRRRELAFIGT